MPTSVVSGTVWAARKLLVAAALGFIGLFVGISSVLLPQSVPFGILGLAALVLIWTMPDLRSVPNRLAKASFSPMLFTCFCVPFYIALVLPGLPLFSIRRLALFLFAGAMTVTLAGSSDFRALLSQRLRHTPLLSMLVLGYFAITVATIPVSSSIATSVNAVFQTSLSWYLPFLAVLLFVESETDTRKVLKLATICMIIVFFIGTLEYQLKVPVMWRLLPAPMRANLIANFPMYAGMETGAYRQSEYRAVATYTVGQSWAEMIAILMPITAYFIFHGQSKGDRVLGICGLVAGLFSLFFSGSRGGYVCTIAGLGLFVVLWAAREVRSNPARFIPKVTLFVCGTGVSVVMAAITFVPKFHIMVFGNGAAQTSDQARALEWITAWPHIYRSPIWGHGVGTAATVVNYGTAWGGQPTLDDYRINLLVDTGVIGFTSYFGFLTAAIYLCCKIYITRSCSAVTSGGAIGCALTAYTIDRMTLSQTDNNTFMYILLGLVCVLHRISRTGDEGSSDGTLVSAKRSTTEWVPPSQRKRVLA